MPVHPIVFRIHTWPAGVMLRAIALGFALGLTFTAVRFVVRTVKWRDERHVFVFAVPKMN